MWRRSYEHNGESTRMAQIVQIVWVMQVVTCSPPSVGTLGEGNIKTARRFKRLCGPRSAYRMINVQHLYLPVEGKSRKFARKLYVCILDITHESTSSSTSYIADRGPQSPLNRLAVFTFPSPNVPTLGGEQVTTCITQTIWTIWAMRVLSPLCS